MAGDVTKYIARIPVANRSKPNFVAMVSQVLQPFADLYDLMGGMNELYDIDTAVGVQLDAVGMWIGRSRQLNVAITDVYFSFDDPATGFDLGIWKGPFDPDSGLVSLPDDFYRLILKAQIVANQWNGEIDQAYDIWSIVFATAGFNVAIQDYQDMSMDMLFFGAVPDPLMLALITGGYFALKPMTVRIRNYITPSAPGPLFGFDIETDAVSGFDVGSWAIITPA